MFVNLKADTPVYRTWGVSSGEYGHWVSPRNDGPNAKSMLSLPPVNTAENVSTFVLREGTSVLSGKAAPPVWSSGRRHSVVGRIFKLRRVYAKARSIYQYTE